jgi:hypothetical protein
MVKLVASGLIPLPGLVPEVTLQFHAACVLLHETPLTSREALTLLNELLDRMNPGTRRPIRFLGDNKKTAHATMQVDSDELDIVG